MIKFFRNIRANLLEDGKFPKYLKYAVGEILLVVIGILIAVQINNWNVKHQNTKKEILYLTRLTTNLGYDKRLYESIIKEDSLLLVQLSQAQEDVLGFVRQINDPASDLKFLSIGYNFAPNRTTIDNLISSGQIEILRSNYLVEDIFLYYRTAAYIEKGDDGSLADHNMEVFNNLILDFNQKKAIEDGYLNRLENSIQYKIGLIENQMVWYQKQYTFADDLIGRINEEIAYIRGKR